MAGNLWGADVAQLRTLAQQFGKTSDNLLLQSSQLSNQINNNPAWKGDDAVKFRSEWNGSHRALIQKTAFALKQESKKLLTQAEQQEKASQSGGAGVSAGTPGPTGGSTPWGPGWMSDGDSPFRSGWDAYNGVLGLKAVPLGLRDITQFVTRHGEEVGDLLIAGDDMAAIKQFFNKDLWEASARSDDLRGAFSGTGDLLSGKFGDFTEMARGAGATDLGPWAKFGLNSAGHMLGGISVGLDGLDTVNAIRNGETGDAMKSGLKTALGVGSFFPPPVGVACMVAGGAWAAVELIPGAKDTIDGAFDVVGNVAEDGAEMIGEGVKNFFGF
ncbi:WXG100 family type VII secretion target [Arthrobacter sp. ISL-72]|uniref:WXG100 family type VII secretion target n=1 Tax=Arthrobacter sp. ISL-72 TaxID=2819114 RepID=UPI001BE833DC|nr:WXG100 family type VII secretion target [Arthrobacter sp. ISL-72]MBT2594518.1 WXG100 family type VII secretion target [Arthrobacter sp. ISL-72]